MRVVLAPDKFKGSLTAQEVAVSVERGLHRAAPTWEVVTVPVADGGDGTLDALVRAGWDRVPISATGPLGRRVRAAYARRGDSAVVELAAVVGAARAPRGRAVALASGTTGVGEVIAHAVRDGASRVIVGLGGSASTDGGLGLLIGLGAHATDSAGRRVPGTGAGLAAVRHLDLGPVRRRLAGVEVVVAADVDNPLLGPTGTVAVFGPQKHLRGGPAEQAEVALQHWADLLRSLTGQDMRHTPGAGAAGGAGFALLSLGATLRSGVEVVLDEVGARPAIAAADLVVTGEGSLDETTLRGKAPMGVVRAARGVGVPVVAVCGRLRLGEHALRDAGFDAAWPLTSVEPLLSRCREVPGEILETLAQTIADWYAARSSTG